MSATVKIGGDITDLKAKLNQAKSEVKNFGTSVKSSLGSIGSLGGGIAAMLGVGSIAAAGAQVKSLGDELDRIGDLSKQLGQSPESVQRLGNMAKLSGSDMESAAKAMNRLNKEVANGEAADAFDELGINAEDFLSLSVDKQMMSLAEAFQGAEENGQGLTAAYDLFGKSAAELLPILRSTKEDLLSASKIDVVSNEKIAQIQTLNDKLDETKAKLKTGEANLLLDVGNKLLGEEGVSEEQGAERALADKVRRESNAAKLAEGMSEALAAKKEKELEPLKKEQELKMKNIALLQDEMKLLTTRATGSEKQIKAAEREAAIREEMANIMEKSGLSEADARNVAEDKMKLQEQIDKREQSPNRIKGYSGASRESKIKAMGATPYRAGMGGNLDVNMGAPMRGYDGTGGFGTPMGQRMMSPMARAAAMKEGNARRAAAKENAPSSDPIQRLTDISQKMEQHLATLAQGL